MREDIRNYLENPAQLERLYRQNKSVFKKEFNAVYPLIQENKTAAIWNERLNYESEEISWGTKNEITYITGATIVAAIIAQIPQITGISHEFFYTRNIAFIFFPVLTMYFAWKQKMAAMKVTVISLIILSSCIYINCLPGNEKNDTLLLVCIHLPLFLWAIAGYAFISDSPGSIKRRIDFLKFNGDLAVMIAIIAISGFVLSAITIGLFKLIGLNIERFYFQYIIITGVSLAPVAGSYLVHNNPQLVNKVSSVIAKIFTPLVLTMLVIYLAAVIYTGKNPYNDREFLIIFNLLLIGVMAIIFFAVAGNSKSDAEKINSLMLLLLSIITIIVNCIALSAIIFRISEWGITPNRLAVSGANFLILTNLLQVTYFLFRSVKNSNEIEKVETSIAIFLPIYALWTIFVSFILPILFNFK
jgi:hypothetical protein